MTTQIDEAGPGVEDYRSALYEVSIDGTPVYCYSRSDTAVMDTVAWDAGDTSEQSWVSYGADGSATVVIHMADDSPVTSFIIYPEDDVVAAINEDDDLEIVVPYNVRLRVEINTDRANAMHIFATPLDTGPVGDTTDFDDLVMPVVVNGLDNTLTITGHELVTGDKIFLHTTGSYPAVSSGEFVEYEPLKVTVLDANTVGLTSLVVGSATENDILMTDSGSGTFTAVKASWDSDTTLVFPVGVNKLGRLFQVASDSKLYFTRGSVTIGSYDIRSRNRCTFKGPGLLSGEYALFDTVYAITVFNTKVLYAMFLAQDQIQYYWDNEIHGVTVTANPFYVSRYGIWKWQNVHVVQPWKWGCDGFYAGPSSFADPHGEIDDCFAFCADDVVHFDTSNKDLVVRNTFAVATANSCWQGHYWPYNANETWTCLIDNCYSMHLGVAGAQNGVAYSSTVFKSFVDSNESEAHFVHANVTMRNMRVLGPLDCRLFVIGNIAYPYGVSSQRDQAGQIVNWSIENLSSEQAPSERSVIVGRDPANCPTDIAFSDMTIGTTEVDIDNFRSFVDVRETSYNITIDGDLVDAQGEGPHSVVWLHQEGKNNPYPPGFNYPNHYATPSAYQPFEGTGLLPMPRIGVAPGIALQLHESLGEPVYVAQCAIPSSGVGAKSVYPTDLATTPFAWLDVKDQQSWSPNAGGAFSRFRDVIASTVTALTVEENTGQCSGIFWVGGQEDASYENMADNYYVSLGTLVREMRKAVKDAGLFSGPASSIPFIHAKVKESLTYATTVNAAIEQLCGEDPFMACYEVDDLTLMADGTSYDGAGQSLASERAFAAWQSLNNGGSTQLEICNLALANIGDSGTVTSLDPPDGSYQATICNAYWSIALNKTLQRHDWDFSVRRTVPTAIESDRAEWDFCYVLPADFAGVVGVLPEGAKDDTNVGARKLTRPYAAELDAHGVRRLYTNEENATLRYNAKVYDLSKWSESARIALSWMLSALIAPPIIKGEKGMEAAKSAYQMFEFHFMQAAVFDTSSTRDKTQDEYRAIWDEDL